MRAMHTTENVVIVGMIRSSRTSLPVLLQKTFKNKGIKVDTRNDSFPC